MLASRPNSILTPLMSPMSQILQIISKCDVSMPSALRIQQYIADDCQCMLHLRILEIDCGYLNRKESEICGTNGLKHSSETGTSLILRFIMYTCSGL
jgi:hypothetical protein